MFFCELEKDEFQKFIENHPLNDFTQSPKMEEIGKLNGIESCFVGVKQEGKIVAASRIMLQKGKFGFHCYAPRGPILDYQNQEILTFFIDALKKYLKKKKGYVLVIDPKVIYKERDINGELVEHGIDNHQVVENLKKLGFHHQGFETGMDTSKQVRWVFVLPLVGKSEEEIWNEMKPNTRNLIRKAEKIGIQIRELSIDELGEFKKITEETSQRRHFHDRTFEYYQKMYSLFSKTNQVKFLLATLSIKEYLKKLEKDYEEETIKLTELKNLNLDSKNSKSNIKAKEQFIESCKKKIEEAKKIQEEDGDIISLSSAMFMTYGNEVIYLFSGNVDKYMKFNAQYLMQWYMIQYAIQHHFPVYNFYGISGIFDPQDKDYGVYEFKRGFNGHVEEYIGSFSLPLSSLYKWKEKLKKIRRFL